MLTNGEKIILKFFLKSPDQLVKVLFKLKPDDLYEVLSSLDYFDLCEVLKTRKDRLLNLLDGEPLANVLTKLEYDKLKILLTDKGSVVLAFLLKNPDQLYKVLVELKANDPNALFKEKGNAILKSLEITHLEKMLVWPDPGDLKTLLKYKENGILEFLSGHLDSLVRVLTSFNFYDLNDVFKAKESEVVASLEAKHLVAVLLGFKSDNLSLDLANLLMDKDKKGNTILKSLNLKVKNAKIPELLVEVLTKLDPSDLKNLLMDKDNGVLESLLGCSEQLVEVLIKFGPEDLRAVFEIEVGSKKVYEHIKDMLIDSNISNSIKSKLTEILLRAGFEQAQLDLEKEIEFLTNLKPYPRKIKRIS
jgi:hypothetical protein